MDYRMNQNESCNLMLVQNKTNSRKSHDFEHLKYQKSEEVRGVPVRKSLICLIRPRSSSLLWSTFCLVLLVFIRTSWALNFATSAFSLASVTWRQNTAENVHYSPPEPEPAQTRACQNQNQHRSGPVRTTSSPDQNLSDSPSWTVSPLPPWRWWFPVQSLGPSSRHCWPSSLHRHILHLHTWSDPQSPHSPDLHRESPSTSPDLMMHCRRSVRTRTDQKINMDSVN